MAGVDRTNNLQPGWQIRQTFGQHGHTLAMTLMDVANSPSFAVKPMDTVLLKDTGIGVNLFGGLVMTSEVGNLTPGRTQWQVACKDYTVLADKTVVKGDYIGKAADTIIKDFVTQAGSQLTAANVAAGPSITRIIINYTSLTDAINRITRIASVGAHYGWYIDESRDIHWYNQTSPLTNSAYFTDDPIDASGNAYRFDPTSLVYAWDGSDLRTRIFVRGGVSSQALSTTDNFAGTGAQTDWPLTYPLYNAKPAFTLTVGGTGKTVQVDSGGSSPTTQYVVTKTVPGGVGLRGLWWLRTGTDSAPGNGAAIVLTYNYLIPVIAQVDDFTAQSTYSAVPNGGIFWTVINDQNITDVNTAIQRARRDIREYSQAQERVRFRTIPGQFVGVHMKAGDVITFVSKNIPDSQGSWQTGSLSTTYLVIGLTITGDLYRTYEVEAVRIN